MDNNCKIVVVYTVFDKLAWRHWLVGSELDKIDFKKFFFAPFVNLYVLRKKIALVKVDSAVDLFMFGSFFVASDPSFLHGGT